MSAAPTSSLEGFHATATAERADRLVRGFFDAVNAGDDAGINQALARSFVSYDKHGVRSRTGIKRFYSELKQSFSDLRFEVHENIGVLVEGDLVALRTIVTGTHVGDYARVPATGNSVQTSAAHIFRVRDDQIVEHWPVMDTYRILVAIDASPRVANVFQREYLKVAESPGGLFQERVGTEFGPPIERPITREESRAVVRRLYDGVIATGRREDSDMVADEYIQTRVGRLTAVPTLKARSPSLAAPHRTAELCRHTWSPKTTGSHRGVSGTGRSRGTANPLTGRRSTSFGSRADSSRSTGSLSIGSVSTSPLDC